MADDRIVASVGHLEQKPTNNKGVIKTEQVQNNGDLMRLNDFIKKHAKDETEATTLISILCGEVLDGFIEGHGAGIHSGSHDSLKMNNRAYQKSKGINVKNGDFEIVKCFYDRKSCGCRLLESCHKCKDKQVMEYETKEQVSHRRSRFTITDFKRKGGDTVRVVVWLESDMSQAITNYKFVIETKCNGCKIFKFRFESDWSSDLRYREFISEQELYKAYSNHWNKLNPFRIFSTSQTDGVLGNFTVERIKETDEFKAY